MMNCKKYMAEIEETEAGALPSREARAHLGACKACRTFERENINLRVLVGSLDKVAAPADFEFRLRARMRSSEGARRNSLFGGAFAPAAASVAVACFAVVIAASLYVRQKSSDGARPAQIEAAQTSGQRNVAAHERATQSTEEVEPFTAGGVREEIVESGERSDRPHGVRHLTSAAAGRSRTAEVSGHRTVTYDQARATVVSNPLADQVAFADPPVAVRVPKSERSLKVALHDKRGGERIVPVRSVSFGSQELIARAGSQRAGVSDKEVAW